MKNLRITVNGKTYDVQVEELSEGSSASVPAAPTPAAAAAPAPAAQPAQAAPAAQAPAAAPAASADGEEILCPMPGTILSINVKAGEKISEGDVIVVFEAMKMENEIKAPRDCTVLSVDVSKDDTVETGTLIATIG